MSKQDPHLASRREFLGSTAAALVTLGVGCGSQNAASSGPGAIPEAGAGSESTNAGGTANGTGGASDISNGGVITSTTGGKTNSTAPQQGQALVGIVRDASIAKAVADAIAIAGGLPDLSGKRVLLKPNVVCTNPSPYATNSAVIGALVTMTKARGAARVIVADRSDPGWTTAAAFAAAGITSVATQLGAELIDLGSKSFKMMSPAGATNWPSGIQYSTFVLEEADYIINVPCCKHHLMANYTAAIKNWMGIIDQSDASGRLWAHNELGSRLPDLHLQVTEDLVVMDATKICLSNGPFGPGDEASPGIVAASVSPVAIDVTAICLLKHYLAQLKLKNPQLDDYTPWTQPQVVRGMALGLGLASKNAFKYSAQGVSEIDSIMSYAAT